MNRMLITSITLIGLAIATACTTQTEHADKSPKPLPAPITLHDAPTPTDQPVATPAAPVTTAEHLLVKEEKRKTDTTTPAPAPRAKALPLMESRDRAGMAFAPGIATESYVYYPDAPMDRENYAHVQENAVRRTAEHPVSTFSIDVDTGSYSNVRRLLTAGTLPPKDAVRVEELINYFDYDYPASTDRSVPFSVITELAVTPWNPNTRLLHIGIKGYHDPNQELPATNLVFLVDVSGSMQSPDKLGLLKTSLKMLSRQLRAQDRVSLVVYAGASGVVLEPTAGNQRLKIERALEQLTAGGSTNGAAGIRLAYQMARQAFITNGINRVLLATDGDFNVGTVNFEALKDLVAAQRQTGITLTTLGFGSGNYNDQLMEQLADTGNGNYAYIDTLNEAHKVLVEQMSATLQTIASDVKIQIEFNPRLVAEYRLIGYENRMLKREDFNNDKVDAGDIGAGHSVTALYEIALSGGTGTRIDALRYGTAPEPTGNNDSELAFVKLRYKLPGATDSKLHSRSISNSDMRDTLRHTSDNFRFAASVAAFGQLLRGGTYSGGYSYTDVLELARPARGEDRFGYRSEFVKLVNLTRTLAGEPVATSQRE